MATVVTLYKLLANYLMVTNFFNFDKMANHQIRKRKCPQSIILFIVTDNVVSLVCSLRTV